MSADNIIYIQRFDKDWLVWEQSASCDPSSTAQSVKCGDPFSVVFAAKELEEKIGYVEYGIHFVDAGDCVECAGVGEFDNSEGGRQVCPMCDPIHKT